MLHGIVEATREASQSVWADKIAEIEKDARAEAKVRLLCRWFDGSEQSRHRLAAMLSRRYGDSVAFFADCTPEALTGVIEDAVEADFQEKTRQIRDNRDGTMTTAEACKKLGGINRSTLIRKAKKAGIEHKRGRWWTADIDRLA